MKNKKRSYEKPELKPLSMLEVSAAGGCCRATGAACPAAGNRSTSGKGGNKNGS